MLPERKKLSICSVNKFENQTLSLFCLLASVRRASARRAANWRRHGYTQVALLTDTHTERHAGKTFDTFPLLFPSRIRQVILTINASTTSGRPSAVKCESQPLLCCESSCRRGSFRSRCTGGPVLHQAPPASEGDRGDTWRDNSQYNNNNYCHYGA